MSHFTQIANSISIPLLIYNNPFTTGIDLTLDIIDELSKHPNIHGIKDIDVSFKWRSNIIIPNVIFFKRYKLRRNPIYIYAGTYIYGARIGFPYI